MARLLSILAFVLLASWTSTARAEDPPPARARRAEPRVLRLNELVIPGWIHDPGVQFVLERTRPRLSPEPLERSFVDEVVRSTRRL